MKSWAIRRQPWQQLLSVVLAIAMGIGPSTAVLAQQPAKSQNGQVRPPAARIHEGDTTLLAPPEAGKVNTSYVTSRAALVAALRPEQILTGPNSELLPVEVATAAGMKYLGIDPANVVDVVAYAEPPLGGPPQYGVVVRFSVPFRLADLAEPLRAHTRSGELNGQSYLQSAQPPLPSFYMPDESTLLVAPEAVVRELVGTAGARPTGPLVERVGEVPATNDLYVALDVAAIRPLIAMGLAQAAGKMPPEALPLLQVPQLVSAAELTLNVASPGPMSLVIHANDEASAKKLSAIIDEQLQKYQETLAAEYAKLGESDDPVERAFAQYMQRMSSHWAAPLKPERHGASLTLFHAVNDETPQQQLVKAAVVGMLVALLLPAVQAAREAARRNQSMNNMKQLVLALHVYYDKYEHFPSSAIDSDDGKPLLSWRVSILPYLDEQELYNQFHLDEPWDSPHNKPLIAKMPDVFQNPNLPNDDGKTNYLAVVGKECVFDGSAKGMTFERITDGTSNTVMLVEADKDRAVTWTKPDDLNYDGRNPTAGLGELRPGGWLAAFADGHVQFINNETAPETVKATFTRAGRDGPPFED